MTERFIVVVGTEKKEIPVITSVATRSSVFFQTAMTHDWKEARERRVALPDTKVEDFEGYLQWLYTGDITFYSSNRDLPLARFYTAGDFLDDVKFRTAVLEAYMARLLSEGEVPGPSAVNYIWENTPSGSLLRQLTVELWMALRFDKAVAHLFGRDPKLIQYPREFAKEYFDGLVSLNAIMTSQKSHENIVADFKLRMSGEGAVDDKGAEKTK
jgi:hypothetical protein